MLPYCLNRHLDISVDSIYTITDFTSDEHDDNWKYFFPSRVGRDVAEADGGEGGAGVVECRHVSLGVGDAAAVWKTHSFGQQIEPTCWKKAFKVLTKCYLTQDSCKNAPTYSIKFNIFSTLRKLNIFYFTQKKLCSLELAVLRTFEGRRVYKLNKIPLLIKIKYYLQGVLIYFLTKL